MTRYGVQEDGSFRRKHVDELRGDVRRAFRNEAGDDIELREGSPQQQILDAPTLELGRFWEVLEEVYYASFFEDSFEEQLDKHLAIANFERQQLRPATGEVVFSSDSPAPDDIPIPSGTVVQTQREETRPPIPFETLERATIFEGDTESDPVEIEALKPWQTDLEEEWLGAETNVSSESITQFQSPISGVDEVTNPNPTGDAEYGYTLGRDRETDPEYKLRYQNELGLDGRATLNAIGAALYNADPDVVSVRVEQIHDTVDNEYGVRPIILAPDVPDDVIAQAILDSKAFGLDSFGAESGTAEYDGETFTENFDRATRVDIYLEATLHTTDSFPDDGEQRIADAIVAYIGGTDSDDVSRTGLKIGEDVIYDQLIKRIVQTQGVIETDLEIGTESDDLSEENIEIGDDEAARIDLGDIDLSEA